MSLVLTMAIDNCKLSESIVEALIDDLNDLICAIVRLENGLDEGDSVFYDPFSSALEAWVKESTANGRIITDKSIDIYSAEIVRVAGIIYDRLMEMDLWFTTTYRVTTSLEVKSTMSRKLFVALSVMDRIYTMPTDDEEAYRIIGYMYKLGKKIKRIVF